MTVVSLHSKYCVIMLMTQERAALKETVDTGNRSLIWSGLMAEREVKVCRQ